MPSLSENRHDRPVRAPSPKQAVRRPTSNFTESQVSIGGNGPIMQRLVRTMDKSLLHCTVTDASMTSFRAINITESVYSTADNGHTDALEFDDGKLLASAKMESLKTVTYEMSIETVGENASYRNSRLPTCWQPSTGRCCRTCPPFGRTSFKHPAEDAGRPHQTGSFIDLAASGKETVPKKFAKLWNFKAFKSHSKSSWTEPGKEAYDIASQPQSR